MNGPAHRSVHLRVGGGEDGTGRKDAVIEEVHQFASTEQKGQENKKEIYPGKERRKGGKCMGDDCGGGTDNEEFSVSRVTAGDDDSHPGKAPGLKG